MDSSPQLPPYQYQLRHRQGPFENSGRRMREHDYAKKCRQYQKGLRNLPTNKYHGPVLHVL